MLLVDLFLVCLAIGLGAANEQKVVQGNWVFNEKPTSFEISGSRLNARYRSFNFNALYLGIVANETNKRFYWEFDCVQNCRSVGVAKKGYYDSENWIHGGNASEQTRCFND